MRYNKINILISYKKLLSIFARVRIKYILFIVILFTPFLTITQDLENLNYRNSKHQGDDGTLVFFEAMYHNSSSLSKNDRLSNLMKHKAHAFDFKIGVQTSGKKSWQQYWGYPTYGIGFYTAFFGAADTLGKPSALYLFYGGPIKRWKKLGVFYELSLGIAYDFVKYNPVTNPKNEIIGSNINAYLSPRIYLQSQINKRLDASIGLALTHFSNGNTRTPNRGVNIYGPNIALKYNINPVNIFSRKNASLYKPPIRPEFVKKERPSVKKMNFLHLFVAGGGKTTSRQLYDGPTYFVGTIAADYTRQYSHIARWGAGIDLFYDSSLREEFVSTQNVLIENLTQFGVHLSNELLISRVHFITQFGYYLYNRAFKGSWYIRVNLRVLITDSFGLQGGLKTLNGGKADFIECGIYVRLMKK